MLFGGNERTGPPGLGARNLKETTQFHLVPRPTLSGAVLLLPNDKFSWAAQGQTCLLFIIWNEIRYFVKVGVPHIAGVFHHVY